MIQNVEFVNVVKIRGIVKQINLKWEGEKNSIHEVILICGEGKKGETFAGVKLFGEQVSVEGFGVGAVIEYVGYCDWRLGKDGKRYWAEISPKSVTVKVPAHKKDESISKNSASKISDDVELDDLMF